MKDSSATISAEDRLRRVRTLIAHEPVTDGDLDGTASHLHGLCRVAARILPAKAVALSLMTEHGPAGIVAALNE